MNLIKIPLEFIILEDKFRNNIEDRRLTINIKENGLRDPLIVEGPVRYNKFILINGYRRYCSLERLEIEEVECKVEKLTDEQTRLFKRLSTDIHTKRKTGYEIERMIEHLLRQGYESNEVAIKLNIDPYTVKRYIKSLNVEAELKKRAEDAKVGRDGLTRLYDLKNTVQDLKNQLIEKYIDKSILGYHAQSIEKADRNPLFRELPEHFQKYCIDDIINKINENRNLTEKIVKLYSLRYRYSEELVEYMYQQICSDIEKLRYEYPTNFIDYLEEDKLDYLNKLLRSILKQNGKNSFELKTPRQRKHQDNKAKFIPKKDT